MRLALIALLAASCATTKVVETPDMGIPVHFHEGGPTELDVCRFEMKQGKLDGNCISFETLREEMRRQEAQRGHKET